MTQQPAEWESHDSYAPGADLGPPPFIGRETELRRLAGAWRDAYNGARVVALVSGEMGSGKSRLLDRFCALDDLRGALPVRLRLYRDDTTGGLTVLRRALIEALESRPVLRRWIAPALDAVGDDRAVAIGRALDALARRVPLVLVIDDLDGAGPVFPADLGRVLAAIEGSFLAVVSIAPGATEETVTMARFAGAEVVNLSLEPWSATTLAAQIERLFQVRPAQDDLDWLLAATRGLPVLFREALHALLRSGCIALRGGRWSILHPFSRSGFSPLDALPALTARIAALPDAERSALATVALLGRRVPIPLLERFGLAGEWGTILVARDLLAIGPRTAEFTHALFFEAAFAEAMTGSLCEHHRDVLIAAIDVASGARLPRRTLGALLDGASPAVRPALLDAIRAAACALYRNGEYNAATVYFAEIVRRHAELADRETLLDALIVYAETLFRLGRAAEQREVLSCLVEHYAEERGALAPGLVKGMLRLAEGYVREKNIGEAMRLIDRADVIAGESGAGDDLRHRVALRRGELLVVMDRRDEARAIFRRILGEIADESFSPIAFDALLALNRIQGTEDDVRYTVERAGLMLEWCVKEQDERSAVQLRSVLLNIGYQRGDDDRRIEPMLRALIRDTQRFALLRTELNAWYGLAVIHARRFDFAEAIRLIERTIEIRWRVRSIALWQVAVIVEVRFLTASGRDDEALARLAMLEDDAERNDRPFRRFHVELCRALIAVRRGRWEGGEKGIEALRELAGREGADGAEMGLLELEGEILLREPEVTGRQVERFIEKVAAERSLTLYDRRLHVVAALVACRHPKLAGGVHARYDIPAGSPLAVVAANVLETLALWHEAEAHHGIARALPLLRAGAASLLSAADLAPFSGSEHVVSPGSSLFAAEVITFGRLRVVGSDGCERGGRHFGTQKSDSKPRRVLAALAVAAVQGRRLTRERLIDMVWPEGTSPESATNNFHVTLSGLRRVIGNAVDFDGASYALDTTVVRVDAVVFLELLEEGNGADRAGRPFRAYDLLGAACALYTGEFLEGIYDEWGDAPRELLRSKGRAALLRLAEIALLRAEHDTARGAVRRLLELDPTDEDAMLISLGILAAEGERLRALREYERFSLLLDREYGVPPSQRLRDLRDSIAGG